MPKFYVIVEVPAEVPATGNIDKVITVELVAGTVNGTIRAIQVMSDAAIPSGTKAVVFDSMTAHVVV